MLEAMKEYAQMSKDVDALEARCMELHGVIAELEKPNDLVVLKTDVLGCLTVYDRVDGESTCFVKDEVAMLKLLELMKPEEVKNA